MVAMFRLLEALVGRHITGLRQHGINGGERAPSRLERWQILRLADEDGKPMICVSGEISGDARFAGGSFITTSAVLGYRREAAEIVVVTRSGNEYLLGKPHAAETFAKSRLARYLSEGEASPGEHFVAADFRPPSPYRAQYRRADLRH